MLMKVKGSTQTLQRRPGNHAAVEEAPRSLNIFFHLPRFQKKMFLHGGEQVVWKLENVFGIL